MTLQDSMDWFERLTGFKEGDYGDTQRKLCIDGKTLRSLVNDRSYGIGDLEVVSLQELRERGRSNTQAGGQLRVRVVRGDVRELHRLPEFSRALFQVASQFNLLEMTGPKVAPEDGVSRYEWDKTQGPACAIAAGAATIYRNYFAVVGDQIGQTRQRQIDCLTGVGVALSEVLGVPVSSLWTMHNGYAECSPTGLDSIARWIGSASAEEQESIRAKLCIGVHWDVEVTEADVADRAVVSQAFCSALPVSYYPHISPKHWRAFASLVLEAAYEATMWAAVANAQRSGSNIVLLTRLGGGAFGNDEEWIQRAMRRALRLTADFDLD